MFTNCYENVGDFFHALDIIDLVAVVFSFALYFLSFLVPQNEMFIPKNDSNVNFPKSTELNIYENLLYIYIVFFPLALLLLKTVCNYLSHQKIQNFKYFPCLWISFASTFLSLAITNYIRHSVGFPKPDTYFACGYDPYAGRCQKKSSNKLILFISYPSFESTISMSIMTNLAFVIQFIFPFLNFFSLLFVSFGIYFGAKNIKFFNNHPVDVSAALFIGFIIPYFLWNNSKKKLAINRAISNNYQSIYN